jgi:hypothetical protein
MTRKSPLTADEHTPVTEPTPKEQSASAAQPGVAHASSPPTGAAGAKQNPSDAARANGEIDFAVRREIAEKLEQEMHGTQIEWTADSKGICKCPNASSHSGSNRTECVIWIDGNFDPKDSEQWPTKKCAHDHCQAHPLIKQFNHELRSRIGRSERREDRSTPNAYLKQLYPALVEKYGDPINTVWVKPEENGAAMWKPLGLNESFFASFIVREGNENDPAVWDRDEGICLRYQTGKGFYEPIKVESLHESLDHLLLDLARKCGGPNIDTRPLEFKMRSTRSLAPIITKEAIHNNLNNLAAIV